MYCLLEVELFLRADMDKLKANGGWRIVCSWNNDGNDC